MAFSAVRILDTNGLSYLCAKLNDYITDFHNTYKIKIDSAAAAANSAADRANAEIDNISNTYATKEELNNAIGGIVGFEFLIATSLPDQGAKGIIYLIESTSGNQSSSYSTYDEYIWIENRYEKIGTTDINLSNYMTAADTAAKYLSKTDASATYTTIAVAQEYANTAESNAKSYTDQMVVLQDLADQIIYSRNDLLTYAISLHKIGNLAILFFNIVVKYSGESTDKFEIGILPTSARPAVNTSQNILDNNGEFCYFYCDSNRKFGFRYPTSKTGSVGVRTTMIYSTI